jgi:type IV secretory pathway ATPase VirB11/archaellum biosynthesis ATPase
MIIKPIAEVKTAAIILTRRSIIICGVKAEITNTTINKIPPKMDPNLRNTESSMPNE